VSARAGASHPVVWLLVVVLAAGGCASPGSLSVRPTQGQDARQLERDRAECEAEADRERDLGLLGGAAGAAVVAGLERSGSTAEDAAATGGIIAGFAALGLLAHRRRPHRGRG